MAVSHYSNCYSNVILTYSLMTLKTAVGRHQPVDYLEVVDQVTKFCGVFTLKVLEYMSKSITTNVVLTRNTSFWSGCYNKTPSCLVMKCSSARLVPRATIFPKHTITRQPPSNTLENNNITYELNVNNSYVPKAAENPEKRKNMTQFVPSEKKNPITYKTHS